MLASLISFKPESAYNRKLIFIGADLNVGYNAGA